ncbi:MAG: FecR family protein, partial [Syntrophobacterales bacterium]|nr:FecR family protein [Syntrophobacterales bacterium]
MFTRHLLKSVLVVLAVMLTCSAAAGADAVGRLTLVEGQVEVLKDGKLPAVAVKVDQAVGAGDVIRTKSLSRAQITFIDNSTLSISPESRIAIDEFKFDAAQNKRHAVVEIFQGLALAVVNKIIKVEEPDFVLKTHTAIVGVRGTEIGVRLSPNSSTILNFKGYTQVGNVIPEVSRLYRKAFKVAFSFGNWNDGSKRWVFLRDMQGTTVNFKLPPTMPYSLTPADRQQFMRQLATTGPGQSKLPPELPRGAASSNLPSSLTTPGTPTVLNI